MAKDKQHSVILLFLLGILVQVIFDRYHVWLKKLQKNDGRNYLYVIISPGQWHIYSPVNREPLE